MNVTACCMLCASLELEEFETLAVPWDGVSNILVSICNDRTTKATGSDVMRTGYTYVSGRKEQ